MSHRVALAALFAAALLPAPSRAEVFVNELHYDDATASGDIGAGCCCCGW